MVIVAAIDRSDRSRAVRREAESLADAFEDEVHFVHVVSQSEYVQLEEENIERTGRPTSRGGIRGFATEVAAEVAAEADVPSEPVGLVGDAAGEVVEYADERNARYVVVSPRKRSPTGKAIFGSVGQSILLNADRPVVTTIGRAHDSNDE